MLFLLLMVPIPDFLLSRAIFWLRSGSAEVSYALFQLLGVPVLRSGFIFSLPGVTIEIAQECSGIRSSLALVIMGLLAGHLFLRSPWTKAALALAVLPLAIVKNGIRIVTLSLLSIYVDPSGRGSHSLAIPGVPTTLLIDPEGREVARKMGAAEWDGPEMVSLIERTMHGRSASNGGADR